MSKTVKYVIEMADFGTRGQSKRIPLRHVHVTGRGTTRAQRRAHALTEAAIIAKRDGFTFAPIIGYIAPKREVVGTVTSDTGTVLLRGKLKPLPFRGLSRIGMES